MQGNDRDGRVEKARRHRLVIGERGALQLPLALAVLVALTALAGTTTLMHRWRKLTEHQLRLDQCVGKAAAEFRDTMLTVETVNTAMEAIRAALRASMLAPPVYLVVKQPGAVALMILEARILFAQAKWTASQAQWLARMGCGKLGDIPRPLPGFQWRFGGMDDLGPRPWRWPPGVSKSFAVQVTHRSWHGTRAAAARVERRGIASRAWEARWAVPGKF